MRDKLPYANNAVIQQKITAELDKIDKLKRLILQSRREVVRLQGELTSKKTRGG